MPEARTQKTLIGLGYGLVFLCMLVALSCGIRQSRGQLNDVQYGPLLAAAAVYAGYCCLNAYGWILILRVLGYAVASWRGICLWIRSESFRWLPGSVWNFGVRSVEISKCGVPKLVAAGSMTLELFFAIATRIVFAALGGALVADQVWAKFQTSNKGVGLVILTGLLLLVALASHSATCRAQWQRLRTMFRQLPTVNSWTRAAGLFAYFLALGWLQAWGLKCLLVALTGNTDVSVFALVVANSTAWLVGFFAIFAPGGLVIREATLATALSAWFSPAECVAIAVGWRLLQTVVEMLLLAGVLGAKVRLPNRKVPSRSSTNPTLPAVPTR